MRLTKIILVSLALSVISMALLACAGSRGSGVNKNFAPVYIEKVQDYNYTKNKVIVREVIKPTMAALDYAAYNANPLFFDSEVQEYKRPEEIEVEDISFDGLVKNVVNDFDDAPIRSQPLSWGGMKNRLWEALKDDKIIKAGDAVSSFKWNDDKVFKSYQQISALFLDGEDVWVRIDFAPWVDFIEDLNDSDGDGIKEVYAKFVFKDVPVETRQRAFNWLKEDYMKKVLTTDEVVEWAQVLASYWYPTLNTDLIYAGQLWPRKNTEEHITAQLNGVSEENPLVIIKGNPMGTIIYNVFSVSGMKLEQSSDAIDGQEVNAVPKKADRNLPENYAKNMEMLAIELEAHGGSYESWDSSVAKFMTAQIEKINKLPAEQMGFVGENDWLFFRRSLEYTTAKDYTQQDDAHNPIPHILAFKNWLEENEINFLLVPIPPKTEVYSEYLPGADKSTATQIINPWYRKFIQDAQDEGIEVIDLLPEMLAAKGDVSGTEGTATEINSETVKSGIEAANLTTEEKLYQKDDTHWTNRGIQIAATKIANRIKQYSWYSELGADTTKFTTEKVKFNRRGDIVERLPSDIQNNYAAVELEGVKVFREGKANKGNKNDPVALMGDSFTGVYELVDCKNAGIGSHIAAKTGLGVDIITSWGGGPNVRSKAYRARSKHLAPKRLFVYMMAARDFYNYSQGWKNLEYK